MANAVWIIIKFAIVIFGLFSAYQMGKHAERPKNRWPKGGIMKGGWAAMEPIHWTFIALLAAFAVFQDAFNDGMGGGMFGGMFGGGGMGGGGMFGGRF
jgi:hypothetical protein